MSEKLTRRESRFVEEYILCWNASKAARNAGYSERSARELGRRLMKEDKIVAAINARLKIIAADNEALIRRTLMEYQRIAFANPQDLFDCDGKPIDIHRLDADAAAVIAGIEFEDVYEGRGESREFVGQVRKYKLVDKKGALDSISRYLGMFNDNLKLLTPPGQPPIAAAAGFSIDPSKLTTEQLKTLVEAFNVSAS